MVESSCPVTDQVACLRCLAVVALLALCFLGLLLIFGFARLAACFASCALVALFLRLFLPVCVPAACLPAACLPACLSACCLSACPHACMPACSWRKRRPAACKTISGAQRASIPSDEAFAAMNRFCKGFARMFAGLLCHHLKS